MHLVGSVKNATSDLRVMSSSLILCAEITEEGGQGEGEEGEEEEKEE